MLQMYDFFLIYDYFFRTPVSVEGNLDVQRFSEIVECLQYRRTVGTRLIKNISAKFDFIGQ
jgi:hypothetical protein